jgi:hypothetical protein
MQLLRFCAHALLEPGVLRLACGASDRSWRGGVHGPGHIFFVFLRILLTLIRLFLLEYRLHLVYPSMHTVLKGLMV